MKLLKVITSILTTIVLLVGISPILSNAEEYYPPVFISAKFAKETFAADEPIIIQVNSKAGTNPINYVWVQIEHEGTGKLFYSSNVTHRENGTEISINLPKEAPPGTYVIQAVSLIDTAGVSTDTFRPGSRTEVMGETKDIEKPIFNNAKFNKSTYKPGDEVVLQVDSTDNQSGIKYVFASIQHKVSKDYTFTAFSKEVNGHHEVRFKLPYNALNGDYKIQYLTIRDNAENELNVFDAEAEFNVVGGSSDIEAPVLHGIAIEKGQYKQGEQVYINIEAVDESGVKSAYLYIRHKQTGVQYNAFATFNGTTFDFRKNIPLNAPLGKYEVFAVYLEDNMGNSVNLFNYEPRIEFDVIE